MTTDMDDMIYNAWRHTETNLDEEGWNIATSYIFECLMGSKPNLSTPEGCAAFNTFSTTYNEFCTVNNFKPAEGFEETHDTFFKYFSKKTPITPTQPLSAPPAKTVRFTSAPPIETLPKPPSSSPEDFPALQAPSKAPISYASATSAFIPITCRRRGKQPTTTTTPATSTPAKSNLPPTQTPNKANTPKSLRPTKPPLLDALKTTKHTIILDHSNPDTKAKYSMDAREITRGL